MGAVSLACGGECGERSGGVTAGGAGSGFAHFEWACGGVDRKWQE